MAALEKVEAREDRLEIEPFENSTKDEPVALANDPVQHVPRENLDLPCSTPSNKFLSRAPLIGSDSMQAAVGVYLVQVLHLTGSGLLANNITPVVGGSNKATSVVSPIVIAAAPSVSQGADYWGRKPFIVVLTACAFVGCIVVSRVGNFGNLIAGQGIGAPGTYISGAQPTIHAIASEIIPRKFHPLAQSAINVVAALGGIIGLLMGEALVRHNPSGFRTYFYA